MSAYHDIFISPVNPLESFVRDLSEACGVSLQPQEDEYIKYSASLGRVAVEVELGHDYEEDQGIEFEKYDALITIRDFDRDKEREEGVAREIFHRLAGKGTYSLALVYNLQILIDRAEPSV
jgi:hypothetical protein